ncbi:MULTISPECIES: hypothetical protein, partial [unclassified Frankia]|uniref:hypothetical protein n=1 Tax=unclassified Frankia TaxID=2632575 RepID=UPI002AD4B56D
NPDDDNIGKYSDDQLYDAASAPYGKARLDADGNIIRGQSKAGRALQKHADLSRGLEHSSLFPSLTSDAERTAVGNRMIMDLLKDPAIDETGSASSHYGDTVRDLWSSSGWGARWSMRGGHLTFEGFLG